LVVELKNLFHKGAKERSEFVRKRKEILGLGFVAVLKQEWTVREVEEVVEAKMALWKRVRMALQQAAAKIEGGDKLGKG
jgi:hypothetical protein